MTQRSAEKISKLGFALALPFFLLLGFAIAARVSSDRPLLVHGAGFPWTAILAPVESLLGRHFGERSVLVYEIFRGFCVVLNAILAYGVGILAARNRRSVTGAVIAVLYLLVCAATLAYVLSVVAEQNLAGVALVLLAQPWMGVIEGPSSAGLGWLLLVLGVALNAIYLYCFGAALGFGGRRIRDKLSRSEEESPDDTTVIHGAVGASGPGGGRGPGERHWALHLELIAWREREDPVRHTKLLLTKRVSDSELRAIQDAIEPESVIACRIQFGEDRSPDSSRAVLRSLLDEPDDPELEAVLAKYREPVQLVDPVLGVLTFNRSVDWFEGSASWLGEEIRVHVAVEDDGKPEPAMETAKELFADRWRWAEEVLRRATEELLELKNGNWLQEGEAPLSRREFVDRMTLESISAYPEGHFEFCYEDGDLFWGHSIVVSGTLSEGPTDANIAG